MATSNQAVETVTSGADRVKIVMALAAVAIGIVGFYMLAQQPLIVRLGSIIAGFAVGILIAWFSGPGQRFFAFSRDSWAEARRVVWPTRKETGQMTLTVFGFVILTALFLWLVDKTLEWVLYGLVLGWKG